MEEVISQTAIDNVVAALLPSHPEGLFLEAAFFVNNRADKWPGDGDVGLLIGGNQAVEGFGFAVATGKYAPVVAQNSVFASSAVDAIVAGPAKDIVILSVTE